MIIHRESCVGTAALDDQKKQNKTNEVLHKVSSWILKLNQKEKEKKKKENSVFFDRVKII